MQNDLTYSLRRLIRSYGLQLDYLHLLACHGRLHPDAVRAESAILQEKLDHATERLCRLRHDSAAGAAPDAPAIDPALIPDMQYV